MRTIAILVIALALAIETRQVAAAETPAAEKYQALLDQYEQEGGVRAFAKRFLELAAEHPQDPVSVDALAWVVGKVRGNSDTEKAIELLLEHHVQSSNIGPACKSIAGSRCVAAEKLLRAVLAQHPDQQVRAQACYSLALLLESEANILEQLKSAPDLAPRILEYYGPEYGKHLSSLDPLSLSKQREQVYARMLSSFSDTKADDTTLGAIAEAALFAIRHLAVGKSAPEITGKDIHDRPLKLSDFRGKVVMLSFWGHW